MHLKFKKLKPNAILPKYASEKSSGMELYACLEKSFSLESSEAAIIPTGLAIEMPHDGYEAEIRPSRALSVHALSLINPREQVDVDDICVILINHSNAPIEIHHGDCIAELVVNLAPIKCFPEFEEPGFEDSKDRFAISESAAKEDFYKTPPMAKCPSYDEVMDQLLCVALGKK